MGLFKNLFGNKSISKNLNLNDRKKTKVKKNVETKTKEIHIKRTGKLLKKKEKIEKKERKPGFFTRLFRKKEIKKDKKKK